MDSELSIKVGQREETVVRVEALLIFPVAAFHFPLWRGV